MFLQREKSIGLLAAEYLKFKELTGGRQECLMPANCPSVHLFLVLTWYVDHVKCLEQGGVKLRVVFLWSPTVGIVCLVVHHQLVVHKVEAVRLRLIRVQDHLTH